jgi:hypothetical protein
MKLIRKPLANHRQWIHLAIKDSNIYINGKLCVELAPGDTFETWLPPNPRKPKGKKK